MQLVASGVTCGSCGHGTRLHDLQLTEGETQVSGPLICHAVACDLGLTDSSDPILLENIDGVLLVPAWLVIA